MTMTALITGPTSGIGYELAKCFARDGHHLVLVSRNEEKLNQVAAELREAFNVEVRVLPEDLSDPEAPQNIYDALEEEEVEIDYLVNNAGYGLAGEFVETDLSEELDLLEVNVSAPMVLTKLFLEGMAERDRGGVLNVASTAAFVPVPKMAVYGAAKTFILSFTEALSYEMRNTNVTISVLCPGATRTGFVDRAGIQNATMVSSAMVNWMSPEAVARMGYRAFMNGKTVVPTGLMNRLTVQLPRFVPRRFAVWITDRIMGL